MNPNVLVESLSISAEKAYRWVSHLSLACRQFDIESPNRRAAFLTIVWIESKLERTQIDLRSIPPRRIQALWPEIFPTVEDARPFAGSGSALANRVFANLNGNGSYESGDGWRFRPRGLMPLCGRWTYENVSFALEHDFIEKPDSLAEDHWAALSAGWYWHDECFNEFADLGDIHAITRTLDRRYLIDGRAHFRDVEIVYREILQVMK